MTADQTASFIYLSLLVVLIGSYFFLAQRRDLGRSLRHAGLWALIFVGVIVAYGLWDDVSNTVMPRQSVYAEQGRIEVPMGRDGHYHMVLGINGTPVQFIVDTGASDMVLSREDASRAGIDLDGLPFGGMANTANGPVRTAFVRVNEVSLGGGIVDRNVPALVSGGDMPGSLLGMGYLNRFSQVSFGNGRMVLTR
ncbi:TIGR02281 family clan AA aspartic protease [Tropicimonas sp. IMCC34043]|uniref:retropepsin-like aspartic protease family protein n=1 Tax=Tropicimonas sp. IMCC34043 TaxID=2248760 RepID=UPI000E276F6C|nr:TIGR02281 family clan AA aspartic protease [Tropicimonas sp. IMCC34043]